EALDAALAAKDLDAANEIEAVIKAMAKKKPAATPTSPFATEARRKREDLLQAANDAHLETLKVAEVAYLDSLKEGLDAAITAKDLAEANRIDAVIKELQATIDARNVTDIVAESASGLVVEKWASGLGDIRGVTVGPDDVFGRHPYVYSVTRLAVLRVSAKGKIETFAQGFKAKRTGRIVFARGGTSAFGNDMFVTMPADLGEVADLVMRVKPNGITSLFHSGPKSMAKGAAFGTGSEFGDFLYVVNPGDKGLYRIDASSEGSRLGSDISSDSWEDDMIFTTGVEFGENAYLTDGVHGKLLRLNNAGRVTEFANVPGAMSIAQGEGVFGAFLYVGTFDGNVFRVSPSGEVNPFLTGFGTHSPEGNFRGIDVEDDQMWLTTDTGDLLRVTLSHSDYPSIAGEWQEAPGILFSITQNGAKFTATTTYRHESAGQIRALLTGTVTKERKVIAEMEHIQAPASWAKRQTREGML
ncbi:MAG: hypothetical protein HQ402_04075, partial [Parcubacteria group bacterium]|nr:hypothetical protein [Parcubacteria group bacterium]